MSNPAAPPSERGSMGFHEPERYKYRCRGVCYVGSKNYKCYLMRGHEGLHLYNGKEIRIHWRHGFVEYTHKNGEGIWKRVVEDENKKWARADLSDLDHFKAKDE